jgi:hypothetical protein
MNPFKVIGRDLRGVVKAAHTHATAHERALDAERPTTTGQVLTRRSGSGDSTPLVARDSFPIYVEHLGLPLGTELVSITPTKSGTKRTIRLPAWTTKPIALRDIQTGHARFTNGGISVDAVKVRARRHENARIIDIYTVFNSAFDTTAPGMPEIGKKIPLGYDMEGETRWIDPTGSKALHTIVAGITGSGKTNTMKHLMSCYAELGWEVWLGDPTGGSEFWEYLPLASTLATTGQDCSVLLAMAAQEIERRYEILGREKVNFWTGQPIVVFVDELPLVIDKTLVIGVDAKGREIKQGLAGLSAMRSIVMRGRRAGVTLIVGIQSPRADDMSGAARSQFPIIICHKVAREEESRLVLGEGSMDEGMNAKRLPYDGRAFFAAAGSDTDQIQVWKARAMSKLGHLQRTDEPTIVSGGFGDVSVLTSEEGPETLSLETYGTTEQARNETPQQAAQRAQARLAKAAKSKWATPVLSVLAEANESLGPTEIARRIGSLDGQDASKGRVLSVLNTLANAGFVEPDGVEWCLSPATRDLFTTAELNDFYDDDDED